MDINLKTPSSSPRPSPRSMIEPRLGQIINIASMLSFQGGIRVPAYTASKRGIAGITKLLANELAPQASTSTPSRRAMSATDNTEALRADPDRNAPDPRPHPDGPLGRAGGHRRRRSVFLASPASNYVTARSSLSTAAGWRAKAMSGKGCPGSRTPARAVYAVRLHH